MNMFIRIVNETNGVFAGQQLAKQILRTMLIPVLNAPSSAGTIANRKKDPP